MSRPKDPNSTRQKAMLELDKMKNSKRSDCLLMLSKRFPKATTQYINTLWATHRRKCKDEGTMFTIYTVKDMKDGKIVKPYIKIETVFNPPNDAAFSTQQAKYRYEATLLSKIDNANQL